ncbi:MAG: glycerophosphodiester phosphodiesterase [Candidatus Bathyarchaeia archaeon]
MVIVTGHRGAAGLEPENTIRSFKRALELGVDQVELDVHLTKDRRLAVIHDTTVDRTTNGHGHVGDLTLEEIRKLDAGKGERVPTLQEAIDVVRGRAILQIELKGLGVEEAVVKTVEENRIVDEVILTSFRHYMVKRAKTLNPRLSTGVLFLCIPMDAPRLAIDAGAEGLHANVNYIDAHLVEDGHRYGLKVRAWNTDDPEQMRWLLGLGVDAIGSDRPDILLDVVRNYRE